MYIFKNDSEEAPRLTATNVFKSYIVNTPQCLKNIFYDMINIIMELYILNEPHYIKVANFGLKEFAYKYGDAFVAGILNNLNGLYNSGDITKIIGIARFMKQFVFYYNKNFMTKDRVQKIGGFLKLVFINNRDEIWKEVMMGLRYLSEMTGDLALVEDMIENLVISANKAEAEKDNEV